jgi:alpha-ketoglutaric semialdehyde dehydrogenase
MSVTAPVPLRNLIAGDWLAGSGDPVYSTVTRKPLGVVGVITPFNFPIAIPAWKIAPALVFGNAVVWTPASTVPLLAMHLASALTSAGLPAGVLNLVIGGSEIGDALVGHPGIDGITFTGATGVGRRIAAAGAARGIPVQAEMAGKNAAIVLEDADIDLALQQVMFGPVLAVRRAADADEAFTLANDSEFGLSAAVFTQDLTRDLQAVDQIDVGVLQVNSESGGADPHVPFGGAKKSGLGPKEQGTAAREFCIHTTTVYLRGGGARL